MNHNALHHMHTLTFSFSTSTVLIIKSTPIVAPWPGGNNPYKTNVYINK